MLSILHPIMWPSDPEFCAPYFLQAFHHLLAMLSDVFTNMALSVLVLVLGPDWSRHDHHTGAGVCEHIP
jgi:hypothetical protein